MMKEVFEFKDNDISFGVVDTKATVRQPSPLSPREMNEAR